jgi:hypothetical protein
MRSLVIALLVTGCRAEVTAEPSHTVEPSDDRTVEANAGEKHTPKKDKPAPPKPTERAAATEKKIEALSAALCVTTGTAKIGGKVDKPAMRAVAKGTDGDAAALTFTFHGDAENPKKLASGELRRQIGLKLRAANGCNLIYAMWRLDPKPTVNVQVKRNPGAKDHKACGTAGYKTVKPAETTVPPELAFGENHTMRAEIGADDELRVFIDDTLHWRGTLPESVRDLRGPAGLRSDNIVYDLVGFGAPTTSASLGNAKCVAEDTD